MKQILWIITAYLFLGLAVMYSSENVSCGERSQVKRRRTPIQFQRKYNQRKETETKQNSSILLSSEDLKNAFQTGNYYEWYLSDDKTYTMNVGDPESGQYQNWVMPDIQFTLIEKWEIVPVQSTPGRNFFPTSNLASKLKTDYDETQYEYYEINDTLIRQDGFISYDTDEEVIDKIRKTRNTFITFPVTENYENFIIDTVYFNPDDDEEYYIIEYYVEVCGQGTLNDMYGKEIDVIQFYWEVEYLLYDGDYLEEEETERGYSWQSKEGHHFEIELTPDASISGEVEVIDAVYERITPLIPSAITENDSQNRNQFVFFPNPANQSVQFPQKQSFSLFDITGRMIQKYQNVNQITVSSLPNGTYILKPADRSKGKILTVLK